MTYLKEVSLVDSVWGIIIDNIASHLNNIFEIIFLDREMIFLS